MLRASCPYAPARPGLDELVARPAPQVKRIACHLLARLPASVQIDDLIQAGMLGLIEAARRYDASQGASFATFAEQRIRGAMLDEIRRGDWTPRSVHRRSREVAAAIRAIETETGREAQDTDVALRLGAGHARHRGAPTDVGAHLAPQGTEAAGHLRADGAPAGTQRAVFRPELCLGRQLGDVLADGQRLVDAEVLVHQDGDLARPREREDLVLPVGLHEEAYLVRLEGQTAVVQREPGAHGPRGVVERTDDEAQHRARMTRWPADC